MAGRKEKTPAAQEARPPAPLEAGGQAEACPTLILRADRPEDFRMVMALAREPWAVAFVQSTVRAFELWEEAHRVVPET
jgi:hypothetical protein